eukprot:scaffold3529_cov271-Amphora_coffeaeformis.AAC.3
MSIIIIITWAVTIVVAVAVMIQMKVPFGTNLMTAVREKAQMIHEEWGVGYQTPCGGTGLLLFLSQGDRQIFVSRGKALMGVLSDDRITYVVGKMKPNFRDQKYAEGLEIGVQLLTDYISGDRPGFDENMEAISTLLGILGIFCACIGCCSCIDRCHRRRDARLRESLRGDLALLDRDRARALQGQYQATSCPICLDEFQKSNRSRRNGGESQPLLLGNHNEEGEELVGSDGKALKLLPCGHAFDQTCWDDFSSHPTMGQSTEGGMRCPICRQPTDEGAATRTVQGPMNDLAYQEERRFRLERLQEMYPTFIGTQYIDQWYDPDYRGSLLDDYSTMEEEQHRAAEQAAAERDRMFSIDSNDSGVTGFGGGKADGGGVGDAF